jgi:DNA-binding response OmpR family regulator
VPVASNLVCVDLGRRLILMGDQFERSVPNKQFSVLRPLAENVGETVSLNTLIDLTSPGLISWAERRAQQIRVQRYISELRQTFDSVFDGLGDPETGIIQSDYGVGYYLSDYYPTRL